MKIKVNSVAESDIFLSNRDEPDLLSSSSSKAVAFMTPDTVLVLLGLNYS